MTLSAGSHPDDDAHKKPEGDDAGKALEPSLGSAGDGIALAAFLSSAGPRSDLPPPPRPFLSKLLDYSAHAAMIVGLLGFAWTISEYVGRRQPQPVPVKVAEAPVAAPVDETAELRRTNQKMAADITALRLSLDSLRATVRQDKTQDKTTDQMRALSASVESVKTGLNATKTETGAALAQLSSKIDHLPHAEATTRIQQIADRLDKMERTNADQMTTASLAPARDTAKEAAKETAKEVAKEANASVKATPVALPPVRPVALTKTIPAEAETPKKPQVLADWVVRDVYDGVAIVEGRHGPMEVVPGVSIPGAGIVKSIDRRGGGWTVTTSKGQLAYAPPPRDRAPRDYYRPGPGPEDF